MLERTDQGFRPEPETWLRSFQSVPERVWKIPLPRRWWINVLLFCLTLLTSTAFGFALTQSFAAGRPLDADLVFTGYLLIAHGDPRVWSGLQFSAPLLLILLAHEFGHYFECLRWNVDGSLPYFLPSPTLFGTLGAFIRIRSPIYTRKGLFDIGISGPIAGFVALLPVLIVGIAESRVMPRMATHGPFVFGTPLLMSLVERLFFHGVASSSILLSPVAMAAWGGLLATAFNLFPLGQLDGGHILYAVCGERVHRIASTCFVVVLGVLGFFYWAWWIWAVLMLFFGRRHPLVYDQTPLASKRIALSLAALLIFILSISVVPVRTL
ncbi:MAG TPA: site-2 protease family protein [Bryobacteraceae bacterium]|nr:site-2 protease family protein [Bryobacteraceae bacterium]